MEDDDILDLDSAASALDGLQDDPEGDTSTAQDETEAPEDAEVEAQEDEQDEPAKPAIETPASLNADEKARFAQLPPEAQRMLADVETRRARQVTEATTNAANAQRQAQTDAARATAQAKQQFAEQLTAVANAYAPRQPNPADYADMQQYARDHAQYQFQAQQHEQFMQRVQGVQQEARGDADRLTADQVQGEKQKLQAALPDWFDAEKGPKLRDDLTSIGSELGYTPELMASANAGDLLALNKALGWKRDSEKLKSIRDRQMQGVRAAKKTTTPGVAQPQRQQQQQAGKNAAARLANTGSVDDAAAAIAALGR